MLIALGLGLLSRQVVYLFEGGLRHSQIIEDWGTVGRTTEEQIRQICSDLRAEYYEKHYSREKDNEDVGVPYTEQQKSIVKRSQRLGWREQKDSPPFGYEHPLEHHRRQMSIIETNQEGSFFVIGIGSMLVLVLGRYLLMIVRWVGKTAAKDNGN